MFPTSPSTTADTLSEEYAGQVEVLSPALGGFHNSPIPAHELQKEQPWHRFALYLAAKARMGATEIAKALNKHPATVRNLFKQPWFQKQYDLLVNSKAESLYEQLLEGEDTNSLLTLIELRDDPNVKGATRAAVAFDILDRMKGKSIQRTLSISHSIKDVTSIDGLKKELADLESQEQQLLGASAKQPNTNGVIK